MPTVSLYQQSKASFYDPELPADYADHNDWLFRTLTEATSIATGERFLRCWQKRSPPRTV